MNRANVIKAIGFIINSPPPIFDMSSYFSVASKYTDAFIGRARFNLQSVVDTVGLSNLGTCGTSACLAGTIQFNAAITTEEMSEDAWLYAIEFLGITEREGECLFDTSQTYGYESLSDVTEADVIRVLCALHNHIDVTGVIVDNQLRGEEDDDLFETMEDILNGCPMIPEDQRINPEDFKRK